MPPEVVGFVEVECDFCNRAASTPMTRDFIRSPIGEIALNNRILLKPARRNQSRSAPARMAATATVARVTLKPFVNRVLKDAIETGVDAVIFQIDTFGGRVGAAVQTRVIAARVPSSSMKLSLR
jgi:hypothetical protein